MVQPLAGGGGAGIGSPGGGASRNFVLSMSPMDEYDWFNKPKISTFDLTAGNRTKLCDPDPFRICLIVSVSASLVALSPDPALAAAGSITTQSGIVIVQGGPLVLTQDSCGVLAQLEWWGAIPTAQAAARITVIECILRGWPSPTRSKPE